MKENAKRFLEQVALDDAARSAVVHVRGLGERLKFHFKTRPSASDAILLVGSGRSGTTWFSQVIASAPKVQQIFEPLFPLWSKPVRSFTGWDTSDPHIRSFYLRPSGKYPEWQHYFNDVLTGRFRNYWTDYERTAYFPDRYLLKMIRANLMLGYLYENFQPCIVFVLRHPCAVIHSRLSIRTPWHADVGDILSQEELVEDHLRPWLAKIERVNDVLEAHAVWWALENHIALKQLSSTNHYFTTYEATLTEPDTVARDMLSWIGLSTDRPSMNEALARPSRMADSKRKTKTVSEKLSLWQHSLSPQQVSIILRWSDEFGIDIYDKDVMPRHSGFGAVNNLGT